MNIHQAWHDIAAHYGKIADKFGPELSAQGKAADDVAFLGFEILGRPDYLGSEAIDDGRMLVQAIVFQLDSKCPHLITQNADWQRRIIREFACGVSAHMPAAEYHPTRDDIERSGKPQSCVMLGGNTLLFYHDESVFLRQFVHQRDNLPDNPHKLCYSPPGGLVTDRPSLTSARELREELVLFVEDEDRGEYLVPYFSLPSRYGVLSSTEFDAEIHEVEINLGRARGFAALRHQDFDAEKPVRVVPVQLDEFPGIEQLEGVACVHETRSGHLIDTSRGMILQTPAGNKLSILVPACIPREFIAGRKIFAVDGERIPALEAIGGRPVCALSVKEMNEACSRGDTEPRRALDVLKGAHMRMCLAGLFR